MQTQHSIGNTIPYYTLRWDVHNSWLGTVFNSINGPTEYIQCGISFILPTPQNP